jgi:hypothetical protein
LAHEIEGFDLRFTGRRSWKAERRRIGQSAVRDVIPVAWARDLRGKGAERFLDVWYTDPEEMEAQMTSQKPFVVALADAKDWDKSTKEFKEFKAIFEVVATGVKLDGGIETKVLRRITASRAA